MRDITFLKWQNENCHLKNYCAVQNSPPIIPFPSLDMVNLRLWRNWGCSSYICICIQNEPAGNNGVWSTILSIYLRCPQQGESKVKSQVIKKEDNFETDFLIYASTKPKRRLYQIKIFLLNPVSLKWVLCWHLPCCFPIIKFCFHSESETTLQELG